MNKLGSNFYKKIQGYERGIIGAFTGRQLLMFFGFGIYIGLAILISLMGWPDMLIYVGAIIVVPFVIYGFKIDKVIKEWLIFQFTVQERSYMTEYESEEFNGKFVQEKGVYEWNDFDTV